MQDDEIAQQRAQISAPATDTPARHGGSWPTPEAFNAAYRAGHAVLIDGTVEQREGRGQDPAQDGAQAAQDDTCGCEACVEGRKQAAEHRASQAGAQAAGGATWQPIETAARIRGARVLLWDGKMRIGTWDGYGWEADEGGYIEATEWFPDVEAPR